MPASEDRAISDFPIASSLTNRALALLSAPDGQGGYNSVHAELNEIGRTILETEYTQDIDTVDKSVFGGINENKSVIGYSYDEYDDTTTSANAYAVDDLCIRNNTLYKCIAPTYGAWDSSKWEQTSIADEIGRIDTALSGKADLSLLDGYKFDTFTLESNKSISVIYDIACIAVIGRGASGLYYGHWSGVNAIVTAQNHSVTHSTVSGRYQLTITNNTGMTDRITVIYS